MHCRKVGSEQKMFYYNCNTLQQLFKSKCFQKTSSIETLKVKPTVRWYMTKFKTIACAVL